MKNNKNDSELNENSNLFTEENENNINLSTNKNKNIEMDEMDNNEIKSKEEIYNNEQINETNKVNIKENQNQNSKNEDINQNNNSEDNENSGQKNNKQIQLNNKLVEEEKNDIKNSPNKYKNLENIISDNEDEDQDDKPKEKSVKRAVNNKFIYSKHKNIFYVDADENEENEDYENEDYENENSEKEEDKKQDTKISRVNKNSVNANYKNLEINTNNQGVENEINEPEKNNIDINENDNKINSVENEEIESSENDTVTINEEEEEIEKEDNNEIKTENLKEIYLLELDDNGLPTLQNDEILSCNINSLINISIYNGLPISKDICMITDSENEFPSPFYINEIINEINLRSKKVLNRVSPHTIKNQKYVISIDDNNILKTLKKYKIFPCKINTKIYFRVPCERAGNISFLFMYKDSQNNKIKFTKPFNILVNPLIDLNNNDNNIKNKLIEINQIQMQSIIPKNIGSISKDFEKYYEEASLLEYNFIHFLSFQELSSNENINIIEDQNELNKDLFINNNELNNNLDTNEKNQILVNSIKNLKNKYHIGAITDIILSQTSSESKWIYENKDCTYNLKNTPWLNVSYELDKILMNYSKLFASKKVLCKSAPYIYNINNINQIISEITNYIDEANLYEFFMISEDEYMNKFKIFYNNLKTDEYTGNYTSKKNILLNEITKVLEGDREDKINEILTNINYIISLISQSCINYGYGRFEVKICVDYVGIIVIESYKEKNKTINFPPENIFLKDIKYYINIINQRWIKEIKELLKISIYNIKEYLRYKYLQLNNKKVIDQLIESYFVIKNENNPSEIYLSNGWIMNSNDINKPFPNTVEYGTWYHLKRKVIIFKDTIKINYGINIENTSMYLINYMNKYITNLSSIFDGLFIDSIAYIPISILKYLTYVARKVNPSIILLCSISKNNNIINDSNNTNISLLKKQYVEELGINLFVDDIIWNNNQNEMINSIINNGASCNSNIYTETIAHFSQNLYSSSFIDENKILFGKFKYLKPKKPFNIIYDIYNTQTFYEKFKKLSINIPMLSLIGLLDTSIGSTLGFDQLYPVLPNIEKENRKYDIDDNEIKNLIEKINNKKANKEETFEVFFEYHPNENQHQHNFDEIYSVHLALDIFDYNPNIELTKIKNNLYMTKTRLPAGKYYYQYVINNSIWTYDSTQHMEEDDNGLIFNTIDLRTQNKIIIPDIKLYRKELNNIRNILKNKQTEIYIQKNKDIYGIIRIITDQKSLINNNIDENKIIKCKKKISHYSENINDDSDYDEDEINDKLYTSPEFKKGNSMAKSYDQLNILDESLLFNVKKNLANSITTNLNRNELNIDSYKNKIQNEERDKPLLEEKLSRSYSGLNKNSSEISNNIEKYDGYAVIFFPSFEHKKIFGKGEIIIPGKITELICACYFNREKFDIYPIINDKKLIGAKNEIYFTKDKNYLKCIANIKYINNKTIIDFFKAPPNIGIIIKFIKEDKNIINSLDDNLEILFNKGNEFINYFDVLDINKLLFITENEERNNTNNKRGTYEMKIKLFNGINENNNEIMNNKYIKNNKIKLIYAGINELIELIKIIKRTENQDLFYNKNMQFEIYEKTKNKDNNFFNSIEEKKIIIQTLYKDICDNDNYINYILERLNEVKSFKLIYNFIKILILPLYKLLPSFIKPIYFEKIIISLYQNIIRLSLGKIPSYLLNFGDFAIGLSLSRYEFIKKYLSCSFDSKLIKKYGTNMNNNQNLSTNIIGLNISNGLPVNKKNNKINTRDLLISFNSLFLIPKLFYEAKIFLKLIGSTMKYGLIPNMIDHSNNFNYNARDISWLYIKAIKDYIYTSMDYNFLKEKIYLINPIENVNNSYFIQKNKNSKKIFSVENIIQLIFQYHVQGINFIDKIKEEQPRQKRPLLNKNQNSQKINGLKINIFLDKETGFLYGGNKLNAGTWMNHIGASSKAKNLNIPATPRDGADIEIIALLYNCINFVLELNYKNCYPYENVLLNENETFSFYQWSLLIKKNFEKIFFVKEIYSSFQNKINIYKDYITSPQSINIGLSKENKIKEKKEQFNKNELEEIKNEFKLRPNALLAIYYAPDLFSYENIIKFIENIEKFLLRPEIKNDNNQNNIIGINGVKTLDKTDSDYNGKLDFKDTNYYKTSCGFNIHNGVEFVWLYAIYLMVKIKYIYNFNYDNVYNNTNDSFIPEKIEEMIKFVSKKIIPFIKCMKDNKYMGIPEIIDENGNVSNVGYQSDLKSIATFFELINKLAWASEKIYKHNDNENEEDEISSNENV